MTHSHVLIITIVLGSKTHALLCGLAVGLVCGGTAWLGLLALDRLTGGGKGEPGGEDGIFWEKDGG